MTDEAARGDPGNVAVDLAVDLDALTDEILPALVARLRASRLAELEVRDSGWRVRLRRDLRTARRPSRSHAGDDAWTGGRRPGGEPDPLAGGGLLQPGCRASSWVTP